MVEVTVFLGKSFDQGREWDSYTFPAVPSVGDIIRQMDGPRQIVEEVEFFLQSDRKAIVRVLVKSENENYNYDLNNLVD